MSAEPAENRAIALSDTGHGPCTCLSAPAPLVVGRMIRFAFPTGQDPASEYDSQWLAEATGGRYDVIREIARGGMSFVVLAWDREARRQVALKVLGSNHAASVEGRERFRREALIIARADHPHIVPCYDFVCRGNGAMEFNSSTY